MDNSPSDTDRRVHALLEALPDLMYIFDRKGTYLEYYTRRMDMFYSDPGKLKGKTMREVLPGGLGERLTGLIEAAIDTGELQLCEYELPIQGERRFFESRIVPYGEKSEEKALSIVREITDRKQAEEALLEALAEKDFLMREMNHRIKNNLLMVSSLIGLKCGSSTGCGSMDDIIHQIDAIRLVHEKLSVYGSNADIRLRDFLEDLLSSVFTMTPVPVTTRCTLPGLSIPAGFAVSLGLIINEMATNAVKHGFSMLDGQEAVFSIDAQSDEEKSALVLKVSNTGGPFPADINIHQPASLGLQLIASLVSQLDGTMELERLPVPLYTLRLPFPGR